MHADFNHHKLMNLERRINVLIYLNKDWRDEFGGQLELWDSGITRCFHTIVPSFNRCVMFNTTSESMHGNPRPVNHPDRVPRRSIASTTTPQPGTNRNWPPLHSFGSAPAPTIAWIGRPNLAKCSQTSLLRSRQNRFETRNEQGSIAWVATRSSQYDAAGQMIAQTDQIVVGASGPITGRTTTYNKAGETTSTKSVTGLIIDINGSGALMESVVSDSGTVVTSVTTVYDNAGRETLSTDQFGLQKSTNV